MPILKAQPNLQDLQVYVQALEDERGFAEDPTLQKCLLLGEEVGELFKAVRKAEKMRMDVHASPTEVEEELADILIYIVAIANRYQIDLETAFRNKEEQNKTRRWDI